MTAVLFTGISVASVTSLEQVVTGRIFADYDLDSSLYKIEVLGNSLGHLDVSGENVTLRPLTRKEPLGLFTVLVDVDLADGTHKRAQIRLRIHKYAQVMVTRGPIKRHEVITQNNVTMKKMEVTSLQEQPLDSLDGNSAFRARRNLARGKIITRSAIEPVPDIDVGREVSIVFDNGPCVITAPGRALQSGRIGDRVKIKNTATGKVIYARVQSSRIVSVGK